MMYKIGLKVIDIFCKIVRIENHFDCLIKAFDCTLGMKNINNRNLYMSETKYS